MLVKQQSRLFNVVSQGLLSMLLLLNSVVWISCEKKDNHSSGTPASPDGKPGAENQCSDVVFDINFFKNKGFEFPIIINGYVILPPENLIDCPMNKSEISSVNVVRRQGYSKLRMIPEMNVQSPMKFDVAESVALLNLIPKVPKEEDFRDLAKVFLEQTSINQNLTLQKLKEIFQTVTLADLGLKEPQMLSSTLKLGPLETKLSKGTSEDSSTVGIDLVKIKLPLNEGVEFVNKFNSGEDSLELQFIDLASGNLNEKGKAFAKALNLTINVAGENTQFVPPVDLIKKYWDINQASQGFQGSVVALAELWLKKNLISKSDLITGNINSLYLYMKNLWSAEPSIIDRQELLDAFKILGQLEPSDSPIVFKYQWFLKIQNFLLDDKEALSETLKYLQLSLTEAQRQLVLNMASDLNKMIGNSFKGQSVWYKARELAPALEWTDSQWALFKDCFNWFHSDEGPGLENSISMNEVENLRVNKQMTPSMLSLLRNTFDWLYSFSGPNLDRSEAFSYTKKYVFLKNMSSDQLTLLQEMYDWFYSPTGPNLNKQQAIEESDNLVERSLLNVELTTLIKDTFQWLYSSQGVNLSRGDAFKKTKYYIFNKKLTDTQISRIKESYQWLSSSEGPSLDRSKSLVKAEYYLLKRKLGESELQRLKDAFIKFGREGDKAQALEKAEKEVFGS